MNDKQFRNAVFTRFIEGHRGSTVKELAEIIKCSESSIYAYLRANNRLGPNGVIVTCGSRNFRSVTVYTIDPAFLCKFIGFLANRLNAEALALLDEFS